MPPRPQSEILAELNTTYGGVAEAAGQVNAGIKAT